VQQLQQPAVVASEKRCDFQTHRVKHAVDNVLSSTCLMWTATALGVQKR
jgi:hypothetical protein